MLCVIQNLKSLHILLFMTLQIINVIVSLKINVRVEHKLDKTTKLTVCETSNPRKSSDGDMGHIPIHPEVLEWCCL